MMEVKRLFDLFPYQRENYPQEDAIAGKFDGSWKKFSTDEVILVSDEIALGLLDLGLKKGDLIAIISGNCVQWTLLDQAILKMGGIVVPIYPTSSEADILYICNHAAVKVIFVQDKDLLQKTNGILPQMTSVSHVFSFNKMEGGKHYDSIRRKHTPDSSPALQKIQNETLENDLATVIYTSGTTGKPKGVMLSHRNIVSNLIASEERLPVGKDHTALSFLPLSHIFERMINYLYFRAGISVYYAESLETIGDNLKEIRPHIFTAVPRLLEKVFEKIQAGGLANKGAKRILFKMTVKMALRWEPDQKNGKWYHMRLALLDKIVASKIRKKAGIDRTIAVASGSAALNPKLARFFNGIGVPLVEGYGLTETSPVVTVNGFNAGMQKIGFVGKVITGGELHIASDGEILYRGPNLMIGYYKSPEQTAEVIDKEGWFHTGDIGMIDSYGFLKITDRKKEIFKTSGGKYIAPQAMENKLKECNLVDHVMVIGEYKKFPAALIVPNFPNVVAWLGTIGYNGEVDKLTLVKDSWVNEKFGTEIEKLCEGFAQYEKIKKFALIADNWLPDTGEITPTLKLKRKVILEKYKELITTLYGE